MSGWNDQLPPAGPGAGRARSARRPRRRPRQPSRTARSRLRRWLRLATSILATTVVLATGYGWSIYHRIDANLVTSDLLPGPRAPDGATDILLVGLDSRTDANGNPLPRQVLDQLDAGPDSGTLNTDTLILVRIPQDTADPATAISIPRDSYVDIPGFGQHKINSAYARAANDERARLAAQGVTGPALEQQADQAGRRTLLATVQALTGSSVDHYAEVNLAGFADITQAVGGVPVCLDNPVHDSYSGADFPAGPQTLQGAAALAFVRQRHGLPRGDLDRIVRQQAFMAGLAHRVLSAGTLANPAALSALITASTRYVVLDRGWNLIGFAGQLQGLTGGRLSFRTIPTTNLDLATPADGTAVEVDPAAVRAFVAGLAGGHPAGPAASAESPPTADVRNGTGRGGPGARPVPPAGDDAAGAPPSGGATITAAGVPCVN